MKVSELYILTIAFMVSISIIGIIGVVLTGMDFFNLLPFQFLNTTPSSVKILFRGVSSVFLSGGLLGLYLLINDGEKYYRDFYINAADFKTYKYLNCYIIEVNGMAWYLSDWQEKCFIKKLRNFDKVHFTQYYNVKKNPTTLIKHR